ncbi:SDR family oxidoreductase [Vagococcus sp. BWB3-3]|uniref:SDR family oxidoreductase n=1 Tax=Vagococcus allomyrinae TaxID=2794353 RepID=A0A940PBT3_9ENTE|nr:SDR family oxidoreductase [Vagococcus allomyrinae]MBP1043231.1 SDR family oxidoreductase [Vagococcus allomyrinae]
MKMKLTGLTALVTGSTKGIGKAIAYELASEGVHVIINGRKASDVKTIVADIKATFPTTAPQSAPYDLSQPEALNRLTTQFPKVDLLINNLGIFKPTDYYEINDDDWLHFFHVNVLISNSLARFYLPKMLDTNFGRIVFIASEEALMPSGEMAHYSMTKTMQLSLAKTLATQTKGSRVTVNTVLPGPSLTDGVTSMLKDLYGEQELTFEEMETLFMEDHRPASLIQRFIPPAEIGRLVTFVCSPLASSFSGSVIRADGGMIPTIF